MSKAIDHLRPVPGPLIYSAKIDTTKLIIVFFPNPSPITDPTACSFGRTPKGLRFCFGTFSSSCWTSSRSTPCSNRCLCGGFGPKPGSTSPHGFSSPISIFGTFRKSIPTSLIRHDLFALFGWWLCYYYVTRLHVSARLHFRTDNVR